MLQARESEKSPMKPTPSPMTVDRASPRELVITRTFNGPARIVFDEWTKPELLQRWWAPRGLGVSLFRCEQDVRVGGNYRFDFGHDPKNPETFSVRYQEVTPYTRLVCTQIHERMRAAGETIVTATFDEENGRTRLTIRQLFPSKEALDATVASGMESGIRQTFEQLESLVATL